MQSDWKEIYKLTAQRTGESEQQYKDIGNFVFASLASHMRRPQSLITKLKGVGSWYLRRLRMRAVVEMFPPDFERKEEEFTSEYGFLKNENKKEIFTLFSERLKEYDDYIQMRDGVRKERHKTQVLLTKKDVDSETD